MSSDTPDQDKAKNPTATDTGTSPEPMTAIIDSGGRVLRLTQRHTLSTQISTYISPDDLAGYSEIDPKLAKLILDHNLESNKQAALAAQQEVEFFQLDIVEERKHRHKLELADQKIVGDDKKTVRLIQLRGQYFAIIVCLAGFVLCGFALWRGSDWAAAVLGCTMIVSLVGAFLFGRVYSISDEVDHPPGEQTDNNEDPD